jgi:hypothetical protein
MEKWVGKMDKYMMSKVEREILPWKQEDRVQEWKHQLIESYLYQVKILS